MNRDVCEHMVPLDSFIPCKKCFMGNTHDLLEEKSKRVTELEQELSDYKANNNAAKWNKLLAKRMDEIEHLELQVKYYYTAYESEKALCMKVIEERDALRTENESLRGERCYICRPEDKKASDEGCADCEEKSYLHQSIIAAHGRMQGLVEAAKKLNPWCLYTHNHKPGGWDEFQAALEAFREAK